MNLFAILNPLVIPFSEWTLRDVRLTIKLLYSTELLTVSVADNLPHADDVTVVWKRSAMRFGPVCCKLTAADNSFTFMDDVTKLTGADPQSAFCASAWMVSPVSHAA